MSRSNSNQDGAQRDKMLLEITMKKRKPFLFLIGTGICLAIAAVVLRVGSSLFDNVPAEAHAGPKTNARFVQPEKIAAGHRVAMVSVINPEKPEAATLQLPGQLSAFTDAPIYAQTSGYLKSWAFDIGAKVKANDILGEIDTPEVDQALAQAKAQLQVDQAALALAQVTYRLSFSFKSYSRLRSSSSGYPIK